jgi:hypothetical protein
MLSIAGGFTGLFKMKKNVKFFQNEKKRFEMKIKRLINRKEEKALLLMD